MAYTITFKLFLCLLLLTIVTTNKKPSNENIRSSKLVIFRPPLSSVPKARIVTGPIIGKVTTTAARILLEFDIQVPIQVILTDPHGHQFRSQKTTKSFIPIPFSFEGLQPNTRYTVSLNDSRIQMTESYFSTLSGESGELNFAFVSCNSRVVQAARPPESDLWADLLRRVQKNEIQYLFHIGDQVYLDIGTDLPSNYMKCKNILQDTPQEQWPNVQQSILEIIRNEYRLTWNLPSVKETLAKIPSLTIFDDHEIRNDWGYDPNLNDPSSFYYFYANLARQVYYEYERQLREDINFDDLSTITEEYFYETFNDIGFFFVEYRGIRTWDLAYSKMGESQLGATQTELFKKVFDPVSGDFASLNNAFLVSPLTVIEPGQEGLHGQEVTSKESWGYAYGNEQAEFLNVLRIWKFAKEGREVTILGGDTHIGGYSDIMYNGEYVFFQFTSSCIASYPPDDEMFLSFGIDGLEEPLVAPWSFQHYDWTNNFNYGIVLASSQNGVAIVDTYLVESPQVQEFTMHQPVTLVASGSENLSHGWRNIVFLLVLIVISGIY